MFKFNNEDTNVAVLVSLLLSLLLLLCVSISHRSGKIRLA